MANTDDTTPATKADMHAMRQDFKALRKELLADGETTRRHFDVVAEKMLHDFKSAFGDRTSQHDDKLRNLESRVVVLERRAGLAV